MQDLGIPIDAHLPVREGRRNARLFVTISIVVLIAVVAFRVWSTRDTVTSLHSDNTITSIQVLASRTNIDTLNERIGNPSLIGPMSINAIFELTNRNFAIHIDESGQIHEVTIDTELSAKATESLINMGLFTEIVGQRTIISDKPIQSSGKVTTHLAFASLNPFFDGRISQTDHTGWLSIHKKGLTLHEMGEKPEIRTELTIPDTATPIVQFSSTSATVPFLQIFSSIYTTPLRALVLGFSEPWKIVFAKDSDGNEYYTLLIRHIFELDALASMAKHISSISSLSTTALTLKDHTTVQEIRTAPEPTLEITSDGDTHFLHVSQGDNQWHFTQTPTHLLITNFDSSLNLAKIKDLVMFGNLHSFLQASTLDHKYQSRGFLIIPFKTIGTSNNNVYLFW